MTCDVLHASTLRWGPTCAHLVLPVKRCEVVNQQGFHLWPFFSTATTVSWAHGMLCIGTLTPPGTFEIYFSYFYLAFFVAGSLLSAQILMAESDSRSNERMMASGWSYRCETQPDRRNPGKLRLGIIRMRDEWSKYYSVRFHVPLPLKRYFPVLISALRR